MKKIFFIVIMFGLTFTSCGGSNWYEGTWYSDFRVIRMGKQYTGVNLSPLYITKDYSIADGILNVNDSEISIKLNDDGSLSIDNEEYIKYTGRPYSVKDADKLLNGSWDGQVLKIFFNKEKGSLSMNGVGIFSSLSKEEPYTIKDVVADWVVLSKSSDEGIWILQIKDNDNIVLKGNTADNSVLLSREK